MSTHMLILAAGSARARMPCQVGCVLAQRAGAQRQSTRRSRRVQEGQVHGAELATQRPMLTARCAGLFIRHLASSASAAAGAFRAIFSGHTLSPSGEIGASSQSSLSSFDSLAPAHWGCLALVELASAPRCPPPCLPLIRSIVATAAPGTPLHAAQWSACPLPLPCCSGLCGPLLLVFPGGGQLQPAAPVSPAAGEQRVALLNCLGMLAVYLLQRQPGVAVPAVPACCSMRVPACPASC